MTSLCESLIIHGGVPGGILASLICMAVASVLMHSGQ